MQETRAQSMPMSKGGDDDNLAQISEGTDPLSWLSLKYSPSRLDMVPSSAGIVPLKRHQRRSKLERSGNCASSEGIVPDTFVL